MKSFLSQPLVHFLFIGLSFFLLFEVIGNSEEGDKTIVVNQQDLLSHLQYRSKAFNQSVFEDRLENMNNEELTELIDEYVREEVLYREAKAMGMDQNDYIIKRRMIQKLEFVSEGVSEVFTKPSREALDRYFDDNKDMYFIAPYVTFAHVFFSTDNRSIDQAISMASDELTFLNNNDIPFEGALSRGERFLYHTNYVEREPDYIISHFGSQMTQDIFSASPSPKEWIGPFTSSHGVHLVLLTKKQEGYQPELDEVIERVEQDAERWYIRENTEAVIQKIIDQYKVIIKYNR